MNSNITRRSFVTASAAAAASVALAPAMALADDAREANPAEDFLYEEVDGIVVITGYVGQSEEVVIPRSINGTLVGMVWDGAFTNKSAIFYMELPKGVFYIGDAAFQGCISLEEVVLPRRLEHMGAYAFDDCSYLESIDLPDSLVEIGGYAFRGTWITELDLPSDMKALGDRALAGCLKLVQVELPEGMTTIGEGAFAGDASLEEVDLPEGLTSIGERAFEGTSLTSVDFPESLASIGDYAFEGTSLSSAVVPDGVAYVAYGTFPEGCELSRPGGAGVELYTPLSELAFDGGEVTGYSGSRPRVAVYPLSPSGSPVTSIGERAFAGHAEIEELDLPDSLASIGERAFSGTSLARVVIPDGVSSVPWGTFPESCELVRADGSAVEIVRLGDVTGLPIVEFGSYPQSGGEPEPVEWLVLEERDDGTALLLSRRCLACRPYHGERTDVTWEACDLRAWLNGEFLQAAFSDDERARIVVQHLENPDNPEYGTPGGAETDDMVFCLSLQEVEDVFGAKLGDTDSRLVAYPTQRAIDEGAWQNDSGACYWWLRSPGLGARRAADVRTDGGVYAGGYSVVRGDRAVRPACCVNLKS